MYLFIEQQDHISKHFFPVVWSYAWILAQGRWEVIYRMARLSLWTHIHTRKQNPVSPLFLNCTRRQTSGQRWSPRMQEAELSSHYHRPTWAVRFTELVYFLIHYWDFGLNAACFEYIDHCLLPLAQNHADFSITPVTWCQSPGLSSLTMLSLYDSQCRKPEMECELGCDQCRKVRDYHLPFSRTACLYW